MEIENISKREILSTSWNLIQVNVEPAVGSFGLSKQWRILSIEAQLFFFILRVREKTVEGERTRNSSLANWNAHFIVTVFLLATLD